MNISILYIQTKGQIIQTLMPPTHDKMLCKPNRIHKTHMQPTHDKMLCKPNRIHKMGPYMSVRSYTCVSPSIGDTIYLSPKCCIKGMGILTFNSHFGLS